MRWKSRQDDEWYPWFAWRPVRAGHEGKPVWVWLEWIESMRVQWSPWNALRRWHYRVLEVTNPKLMTEKQAAAWISKLP